MSNHTTIVCIDDDPMYKDLYGHILGAKGYHVVSAFDAAEGYEVIKKEKPGLVTLDVMMPEKEGFGDGFGLLKKLREDPLYQKLPVLMISALSDLSDIEHGLSVGATAYLPKQEMTPKTLVAKIESMLGK